MSSDYGLYESDSYKASRLEQENVELRSRLQAAEEKDKRWQDEMDVACKKILLHTRKIRSLEEAIERVRGELEASQGALREQMKARRDACARLEAVEERYFDLIMCVSRKFPGELRHDTAKRYITESETATCDGQAKAALQGDGGQE